MHNTGNSGPCILRRLGENKTIVENNLCQYYGPRPGLKSISVSRKPAKIKENQAFLRKTKEN